MTHARAERLRRVRFRCDACRTGAMRTADASLACDACGRAVPLRDGRPCFLDAAGGGEDDPLDRLKRPFKRFRRLYSFLVWLVSPLYFDRTRARFLAERVRGRGLVVLHLGSGHTDLDADVLNLDIAPYPPVDVVCDIADLPLEDGSVDGVLTISVLEHVPDPARVMSEIRRVLRPGGFVYTDVPFVVGFHASPSDYHRWTIEGVRELHRGFETERIVRNGGPTSALLWVFQEWIAGVLSFGSRRLHLAAYLLAMLATFPVKFLDVLLKHLPTADHVCSCFIYIGRKPGPPEA